MLFLGTSCKQPEPFCAILPLLQLLLLLQICYVLLMLKKNTGAERFYIMEEKIINGTREDSVV